MQTVGGCSVLLSAGVCLLRPMPQGALSTWLSWSYDLVSHSLRHICLSMRLRTLSPHRPA